MEKGYLVTEFDYSTEAGFYFGKKPKGGSGSRYKRFDTAAEAIRFAIEDMPGTQLRGSVLEVDETRFTDLQIRSLYDAPAFPLTRKAG